jgi:hypothetical protein
MDLLALRLQSLLITINTALFLIYTQFTVAHALGFSVFTCRLLATDLSTETIISNNYEVFLSFLVQSPWNLGTQLKAFSAASGLALYSRITDNAENTVLLQTTQKTQVT